MTIQSPSARAVPAIYGVLHCGNAASPVNGAAPDRQAEIRAALPRAHAISHANRSSGVGGPQNASTSGSGSCPAATASRGSAMPLDLALPAGRAAARHRPPRDRPRARPPRPARTATAGCPGRAPRSGPRARPPGAPAAARARASSMHAVVGRPGGRTATCPARAASSSASASRDLPQPDGPRISTARAPDQHRHEACDGRSPSAMPSHRRQADDEARAEHRRAPRRGVGAAMRFSAQMRPRCASTICLEIERPRPEFWPKPCSGRSV